MDKYDFFIEKAVPYYIPCMYPLVHEYLKNCNCESYISLYPNIEMLGIPALRKNNDRSFEITLFDGRKLGYKDGGEYLGFRIERKQIDDSIDALSQLKLMSNGHRPIIVSGSQYYLPYCNNYKNENYIKNYPNPLFGVANHWVAVYSIESNNVLIRDTTFNHLGSVPVEDFIGFWRGDNQIPELMNFPNVNRLYTNGYLDINISQRFGILEYREIFLKTVQTICCEYLNGKLIQENGRKIYFGVAAHECFYQMLNDITPENVSTEFLGYCNNALYNLRFNRLIYRDLLADLKIFFEREYIEKFDDYTRIIDKLENVTYLFAVFVKRRRINFDNLKAIVLKYKDFMDSELTFFEDMFKLRTNIIMLEKR